MATLIKNISSLVTINANGKPFKCGEEMSNIGEIQNGAIIFQEKILFVGTTDDALRFIFNNNIQIQHTIDALG